MEEVLKDILFQNHVYLFFHKLDKYNPNIDLHTIFWVEINKYNLKIWANMTYSVIFFNIEMCDLRTLRSTDRLWPLISQILLKDS